MQVVRHDVDVVQVLRHLEGLHAAQQVAGRRGRDREQVVLAVGGTRPVQLLPQGLHQGGVALGQRAALAVGELPVQRVARVLHRGRVLVVDVDAVEPVLLDEVDGRGGEGVDARLVDAAVRVDGHRVEAATVDALAVVTEEATRLRPTTHRDEGLDVRVLLLVLGQQVEVPLVRQRRVELRAGHTGERDAGGLVLVVVGTDGQLVVRTDVPEGVVEVGDLVPRDVADQVRRRAVLAAAPAGEVADDAALVIGAHLLAAVGVVDAAVRDVDTGCGVEAVGTTGGIVDGGGRLGGRRAQRGHQQAGHRGRSQRGQAGTGRRALGPTGSGGTPLRRGSDQHSVLRAECRRVPVGEHARGGKQIGAEAMWSEPHRSIGLYQLVIKSPTPPVERPPSSRHPNPTRPTTPPAPGPPRRRSPVTDRRHARSHTRGTGTHQPEGGERWRPSTPASC